MTCQFKTKQGENYLIDVRHNSISPPWGGETKHFHQEMYVTIPPGTSKAHVEMLEELLEKNVNPRIIESFCRSQEDWRVYTAESEWTEDWEED